jgi:6-pyruvoyltetrahydropterin/6-carboxytetrahydropterin synthase
LAIGHWPLAIGCRKWRDATSARISSSFLRTANSQQPTANGLLSLSLSLTRRVRFSAAHRYRRPDWSDERNYEVFGPCANPSYHGHSYVCEVTVTGTLDEQTGFVVDLSLLDHVLHEEVHDRFDHRNINTDVPEFAEGRLIPTGENLARFIYDRVQARLGDSTRVTTVRIAEDEALSVTFSAE